MSTRYSRNVTEGGNGEQVSKLIFKMQF